MPVGTSGARGKGMKCLTLGVRTSKLKITRGWSSSQRFLSAEWMTRWIHTWQADIIVSAHCVNKLWVVRAQGSFEAKDRLGGIILDPLGWSGFLVLMMWMYTTVLSVIFMQFSDIFFLLVTVSSVLKVHHSLIIYAISHKCDVYKSLFWHCCLMLVVIRWTRIPQIYIELRRTMLKCWNVCWSGSLLKCLESSRSTKFYCFLVFEGSKTLGKETDEGGKIKEGLSQCMQGREDCCNSGEQR